jgi:flavin reductase (DIM6/NTAB) family NADH-FMN oxidoreductase RutF
MLGREQEEISRACASRKVEESRRLEGVPYHEEATGSPVLDHAIGYLDCKVEHVYEGGDHTIFVGRVEAAGARDGEPLLYFRSAYRGVQQD